MESYLGFCNELENSLHKILETPDEYFDCALTQLENSDLWSSLYYAAGINTIEHSRENVQQLLYYAVQMKEAAENFTKCVASMSK